MNAAEKHRDELAAAHQRGRQRERDFARKQANAVLHAVIKALDEASGPRAHRVGCECSAAECVRLREAVAEARRVFR